MYRAKIVKASSSDKVDVTLSAPGDQWNSDVLMGLADLMRRLEILKLKLPVGETCFRIKDFPIAYLKNMLRALRQLGFHIDCRLAPGVPQGACSACLTPAESGIESGESETCEW